MPDKLDNSFGFQQVDALEREKRIRHVFEVVARRYDLMNDFMSFGIHRLWKKTLLKKADAQAGQTILDLAGGTGDIAAKMAATNRTVMIIDPSQPMMQVGRERGQPHVQCLAGSGEAIPLQNNSVDTLTIAFGIRNMTHIQQALVEIQRVLKPGGRCLCLEFSKPAAWLRPFYNLFSFLVIPRLGALIAREPAAYTYLVESIRRFPDQEEMKHLMEKAGLTKVTYRNLSFGIACLHIAHKSS
ncbi:2-methoxy-6-polyprenyl-1,4-benzoquinol methylase [hydrothermal vent metagenome]|uniref:2-methoxy-6-polyprenyl-1,4-benzoquinol methylase n=1 Tax=hydrothermal vent metagenome TaxID=652676 RepID=A0A3B1ANF1_9ZZZZ